MSTKRVAVDKRHAASEKLHTTTDGISEHNRQRACLLHALQNAFPSSLPSSCSFRRVSHAFFRMAWASHWLLPCASSSVAGAVSLPRGVLSLLCLLHKGPPVPPRRSRWHRIYARHRFYARRWAPELSSATLLAPEVAVGNSVGSRSVHPVHSACRSACHLLSVCGRRSGARSLLFLRPQNCRLPESRSQSSPSPEGTTAWSSPTFCLVSVANGKSHFCGPELQTAEFRSASRRSVGGGSLPRRNTRRQTGTERWYDATGISIRDIPCLQHRERVLEKALKRQL